MVAWQELHIQSNLPLIVLAISFICVVIIGFLEFKKISIKIEELSEQIKVIQNMKGSQKKITNEGTKVNREDKKKVQPSSVPPRDDQPIDAQQEEIKPPMEGAILMEGGVPPVESMMMGMGMQNIASMIIQGGPPMMPREEMPGPSIYEEDIENKTLEIDEMDVDKYSEVDDGSESGSGSDNDSENDSESGSESDIESGEETESDEEKDLKMDDIKIIQGEGKVEEIKEVDRTSSIKELRVICQKLNISSSGNKESLIQRINAKNKN